MALLFPENRASRLIGKEILSHLCLLQLDVEGPGRGSVGYTALALHLECFIYSPHHFYVSCLRGHHGV